MSENIFVDYDNYISPLFAPEDHALAEARAQLEREGLPKINVSASEGKLLHVLASMVSPRRILEIGTLGGHSAIWLARALAPGGRLISLELDPHHADVSRRNLECAGLADRTEVRIGPAAQTLDSMMASGEAPFDVVFIDADKDAYPVYLEKVIPLTREGGLILGDNTLPDEVLNPTQETGISRYNKAAALHPGLQSIIVPVLRGRMDGLLISVKRMPPQ
jgi:predicted O-methyltransferase YrrM